jgi:hypothetical protein
VPVVRLAMDIVVHHQVDIAVVASAVSEDHQVIVFKSNLNF